MSEDSPFTREELKDWSRRQLTDTALGAMAAHRLLLAENAQLELRIAKLEQALGARSRLLDDARAETGRVCTERGLLAWENELYRGQVDRLRRCFDGYREQERFHEGSVIQRFLSEAYAILGPGGSAPCVPATAAVSGDPAGTTGSIAGGGPVPSPPVTGGTGR